MSNEEIIEGNRTIADWLGVPTKMSKGNLLASADGGNSWYGKLWNKDWNALMMVVEKIEALGYEIQIGYNIYGKRNSCIIHDAGDALSIEMEGEETKIYTVWIAIIQFINFYNTQTTQQ